MIHDHHSLAELHTAALTVYTLFQCFLILWNWILPFSEMPHMHRVSFDVTLLCRSFIQRMAILDTERSCLFLVINYHKNTLHYTLMQVFVKADGVV